MANHRMISNRVINSARFLQMPAESQLLFVHMVLRADDDGVVELYPVMKLLGFAPDSFRVLLARGFVLELNEDQVVVICDWREHNKIRPDRKTDSMYRPLLEKKYPEIELIAAKPRSDVQDNSRRLDGPRTAEGKISKDNKENDKSFSSSSKYSEVRLTTEGDEKPPKKQKDTAVFSLREKLYDIMQKETGVRPIPSIGDYRQIQTALKYMKESDVIDMLRDAFSTKNIGTVREALTNRKIDIKRQELV